MLNPKELMLGNWVLAGAKTQFDKILQTNKDVFK